MSDIITPQIHNSQQNDQDFNFGHRIRQEEELDDDPDHNYNSDAHHPYENENNAPEEEEALVITPSLDGNLYFHRHALISRDQATDGDPNIASQEAPTLEEPVALRIEELLEQPVRNCRNGKGNREQCGIITATVKTSLWSLNAEGELLWKTYHVPYRTTTSNNHHQDSQDDGAVLQRKDYLIQEVSTATGQILWNSTYSTWVALEFDTFDDADGEPIPPYMMGFFAERNPRTTPSRPPLPHIVFPSQGGVMAMDPSDNAVLWNVKAPIASVFGLYQGRWKSPVVLPTNPVSSISSSSSSAAALSSWIQPVEPASGIPHWSISDDWQRPAPLLALPAPPPKGLYLPWPLVSLLVGIVLGLATGARTWYRYKKHQWTREGTEHAKTNPTPTTTHNHSRYTSEFEELEHLGRGGFGSVYRVRNVLDGKEYAMKKIVLENDDQPLDRVLREVKILARLDHTHIVRYYTAWIEQDDAPTETAAQSSSSGKMDTSTTYEPFFQSRRFQQKSFSSGKNYLGWNLSNDRGVHSISKDSSSLGMRRPMDESSHGIFFEESTQGDVNDVSHTASGTGNNLKSSALDASTQENVHLIDEIDSDDEKESRPQKERARQILYIQMQLCSSSTLMDFLVERQPGNIDDNSSRLPHSLRLFWQVAQAVAHVHDRGLIHRDLKPSNCFMDEKGETIKVGDFGLSREAGTVEDARENESTGAMEDDITAGVGTRSYASPEQMKQGNYDSSTDIYSLGIILFELAYQFSTGMERNVCLSRLRQSGDFPNDWDQVAGEATGRLRALITSMLAIDPSQRPTATLVVQQVQDILGEYTILSFDPLRDLVLVRVQVSSDDDLLPCMQVLKGSPSEIVQYGLRSSTTSSAKAGESGRILEFAVRGDPLAVEQALQNHAQENSAITPWIYKVF